MKKGALTGGKDVYRFTFVQGTKTKSFGLATFGIAILLFVAMMAVSLLMASSAKDSKKSNSPIRKAYVCDKSGLTGVDFNGVKQIKKKKYDKVEFIATDDVKQYIDAEETDQKQKIVVIELTKEKDRYLMNMSIPKNSSITKSQGKSLLTDLTACIEQAKVMSSGIAPEKLAVALAGVNVDYAEAGDESETLGEQLTKMFLPMIIVFVLYMMILLYGQSIGKSIIAEKTSKLIEMFLTSIRPSALIFGKVFASISIAVMQFLIWIGAVFGGFFAGHALALQMNPKYTNYVIKVIQMIQKDTKTAFTIGAIVLTIVLILVGFIFYCMVAAVVSAGISKAEDLSQGMGIFTIVTVLGFMGAYMLPLQENEQLNVLLRLNPITGAFLTPGDVLIGNAPVWQGIVCLAVELVCVFVLVILTGKIYRDKVFYKGNNILKQTLFKKKSA